MEEETKSERLCIVGGPKVGKTTLAGPEAKHTDDLIPLGWSKDSEAAAKWFDEPGNWTVEGVAVVRALRKWLEANPKGKPCDRVLYLNKPHVNLTPGQAAMTKGHKTVWDEVKPELLKRGVKIKEQ